MTRRERFLIGLLIAVASAAVLVSAASFYTARLRALDAAATLNGQRIRQLAERENQVRLDPQALRDAKNHLAAMQARIEEVNGRFIDPSKIDMYAFAERLKTLAGGQSLIVDQVQIDTRQVSVQLRGSPSAVLEFLRGLEKEPSFIEFKDFSMDIGTAGADLAHVAMAVGYAQLEK